ncbi:MAG TPA: DNA mismatch repair protein MutS [Gemmatimonadota bacterium]|nr:DNA mismatch repair protein MutS [Gemmatimonadota bacterium]
MTPRSGTGTPLMRQYSGIKAQHRDAILFFRMGDFYEMFYDDAVTAARVLGLTLTSRNNGAAAEVPLAGVPIKAADGYVKKLVEKGFKVAICEQLEDPKQAQGIVERGVIEVVTPGTPLDEAMLDRERNTWLVAVTAVGRAPAVSGAGPSAKARWDADRIGLAWIDCSTGEFGVAEPAADQVVAEIKRLGPAELLVPREWRGDVAGPDVGVLADLIAAPRALDPVKEWRPDLPVSFRDGWRFEIETARADLCNRFGVAGLDGFGLGDFETGIGAGGAIVRYVEEVQPGALAGLRPPRPLVAGEHMAIDDATLANLEILEPLRDGGKAATLLGVIDRTRTAPGARRIRQWVARPLTDRSLIVERHLAIEALVEDGVAREKLAQALDGVHDLERLAGRAAAGRANPRDLVALADTLRAVPVVRRIIEGLGQGVLDGAAGAPGGRWGLLAEALLGHPVVVALIDEAIVDEPPATLGEGPVIREGHDPEIDRFRSARRDGKDWIARLQATERDRTGIPSLKVGFNKVFGYYLEVTKSHLAKVPETWIRKQTISTGERYVTPELKEVENEILGAEERIAAREAELFALVRSRVGEHAADLQSTADALAEVDVLASLADVAARNGWSRPRMIDEVGIFIEGGRHPVVERWLQGETFVPNDTRLDSGDTQVVILTGPNMSGKSTYLRQIGLIAVLGQMGSWVPAEKARLGIVDRLFTRVGASDNLARGQSTFLVEMIETANILHNATDRSLVLLDEIGRGTSTFDGLAIAWAVSEWLHEGPAHPLTVFATHYHELTELESMLQRVRNYRVEVREHGDEVVFVKRVSRGPSDRSYGIHVGRLAGLPGRVVARAEEILANLEAGEWSADHLPALAPGALAPDPVRRSSDQMTLFGEPEPHPMVEEFAALELDTLSPREALEWLYRWRERSG